MKREKTARIKLLHGKHFYGDCGSSNWREAGEEFNAIIKENKYWNGSIIAEVQTPFMQHSIELTNMNDSDIIPNEFEIVSELSVTNFNSKKQIESFLTNNY